MNFLLVKLSVQWLSSMGLQNIGGIFIIHNQAEILEFTNKFFSVDDGI